VVGVDEDEEVAAGVGAEVLLICRDRVVVTCEVVGGVCCADSLVSLGV
jgi:hypothetical protein